MRGLWFPGHRVATAATWHGWLLFNPNSEVKSVGHYLPTRGPFRPRRGEAKSEKPGVSSPSRAHVAAVSKLNSLSNCEFVFGVRHQMLLKDDSAYSLQNKTFGV